MKKQISILIFCLFFILLPSAIFSKTAFEPTNQETFVTKPQKTNRLTKWLVRKFERKINQLVEKGVLKKDDLALPDEKTIEGKEKKSKRSLAFTAVGLVLLALSSALDRNNSSSASSSSSSQGTPMSSRRALFILLGTISFAIGGVVGMSAAVEEGANGYNVLAMLVGIPAMLLLFWSIILVLGKD